MTARPLCASKPQDLELVRRRAASYWNTACSFALTHFLPQSCQDFWTGSDVETVSAAWTGEREGMPSHLWLRESWYCSDISYLFSQTESDCKTRKCPFFWFMSVFTSVVVAVTGCYWLLVSSCFNSVHIWSACSCDWCSFSPGGGSSSTQQWYIPRRKSFITPFTRVES